MMHRKSQAALEFIMTYGWAILVVLVAIGALAYFGVLNPDRFLPSKCTLQSGIACLDHKATPTSLTLYVQNSLGRDITVNSVSAKQCTDLGSQGALENGGTASYTLNCGTQANPGNPGSKYSGAVSIVYTITDTGITHNNTGEVTTKIE